MNQDIESKSEPSSPRAGSPSPQPRLDPKDALRIFKNPENILFRAAPVQKYSLELARRGSPIDVDQVVQNISAYGAYDPEIHTVEEMIKQGNLEGLKYLADIGEDVKGGLYSAVAFGHLDILKYLVEEQKADLSDVEDNLLDASAYFGHLNIIQYLLANFSNLFGIDELNEALYGASYRNHFDVVQYLTEYIWNRYGDQIGINAAISAAIRNKNLEIVKYLKTFATNHNIFFDLTDGISEIWRSSEYDSKYQTMKYLIDNGAIPSQADLIEPIRTDNIEMVELLLKNGANPNGWINDDKGRDTFLGRAVKNNNFQIVKLLLEHKADVHMGDDYAFRLAVYYSLYNENFDNIVKLLLRYGAKVDVDNGWALREAVKTKNIKLVELLLRYGAKIDADILRIARNDKDSRLIRLLVKF